MAKKKSKMQKEVEKSEQATKGQQMDLIDVSPKNSKEIIRQAQIYRDALARRQSALNEETNAKQKLLDLIKKAGLQRLEDGTIKFHVDGYKITVTPRDELVKVKEDDNSEAA